MVIGESGSRERETGDDGLRQSKEWLYNAALIPVARSITPGAEPPRPYSWIPAPSPAREQEAPPPTLDQRVPGKHETLTHCWINVGLASTTLAQHWSNNGSCVCWVTCTSKPSGIPVAIKIRPRTIALPNLWWRNLGIWTRDVHLSDVVDQCVGFWANWMLGQRLRRRRNIQPALKNPRGTPHPRFHNISSGLQQPHDIVRVSDGIPSHGGPSRVQPFSTWQSDRQLAKTREYEPMPASYWSGVCDAGPMLSQRWFNVSCSMWRPSAIWASHGSARMLALLCQPVSHAGGHITANTRSWPNACLILGQRLRRWPNINQALGHRQRLAFAGWRLLVVSKMGDNTGCKLMILTASEGDQGRSAQFINSPLQHWENIRIPFPRILSSAQHSHLCDL